MQPGDWVMAIGNPFGYAHTVTRRRDQRPRAGRSRSPPQRSVDMLQTDAAINPGNSGGPLLNVRGEVIGINTAILSNRAWRNIGIGFAVPINAVRELLPQLRTGKITRGLIGVRISTSRITQRGSRELGPEGSQGRVVAQVDRGGPAAKAGLEPGDVIIEFNGRKVDNDRDLVDMVVAHQAGHEVPVKVVRDEAAKTLSVTVGELNLEQRAEAPATTSLGGLPQRIRPRSKT